MIRPKQRLSSTQKDKKWKRESALYFASVCKPVIDAREANILYKAANGELSEADYLYVTNPYNSSNPKLTKFPSKIRNIDIISTNMMTLMGEKRRRGLKYTTVAINADIENQRKELHNQLVEKYITQMLIAELVEQAQKDGTPIDIEAYQGLTAEQIKKKVQNVSDKAAITAQSAIDYIRCFNSIDNTTLEGWYHFLTTGYSFSYKTVIKDEVIQEYVSPKEMKICMSSKDRFVKDCEAVSRTWRMSLNELIDKFQDMKEFTKIADELESRWTGSSNTESVEKYNGYSEIDAGKQRAFGELWNRIKERKGENAVYSDDYNFLVEHVVWTSNCKVGKVTSISPLGEIIEEEVDDTYVPIDGVQVEWRWVNEEREAWIIEDKWVLGGDPIYTAVGSYNSPHKVEKPYNGLIQRMKHANPQSVVKKGINFQIKYNIIHFYIEKAMAKNMGKIVLVPYGLLPKKQGFDVETSMYYANALGFMFVDETNPKFQSAIQGVKVLDADLKSYIAEMYQYLQAIRSEWDNQIGMTPQRKGQMNSSDGKAVQENALFRSSIMTEELFRQYEEFEETDLNGCLELSKYAFIDGKKAMFVDGENKEAFLNINGEDFSYWDYLIKITNSGEDLQNLENAKGQAQAFAQNQMAPSKVLKLLRSNNISKLIEEMESLEEELEIKQQQAAEQDRASNERVEELKKETAQLNYDAKIYASDKSSDTAIEVATIKTEGTLSSDMFNATGGESEIEALNKGIREREKDRDDANIKRQELALQNKKIETEAETKKYVADKSFQVAKENKP